MKKVVSFMLVLSMVIGLALTGCGSDTQKNEGTATTAAATQASEANSGKPDTWIADRHIVGRAFIDDLGVSLPDNVEDQINNPVMQKVKELTGMTIEWQYTASKSDREMLMTTIAAGDLPDVIVHYLNDSGRKEFPIVLKAAREGMFTDLAPFLKNTKVLSKVFEKDFLPYDTYNNIMFRKEFNGSVYFVHNRINRTPDSDPWNGRGGMYIQKSIADALKIDVGAIRTQDDLYNLLKQIKAGDFKDANGKTVTPLGPRIWGGQFITTPIASLTPGVSNGFNVIDGKVQFEAETDYVIKQIDFYRKLLKEGLIHQEFFTMDSTRADEFSRSNSSAIIGDVHNYMDLFEKTEYLPVGPLKDYKGEVYSWSRSKTGYCAWEIPTTTKNPEEIVKFADFLATTQGKLLWNYGIEGTDYTIENGKVVISDASYKTQKEDAKAAKKMGFKGLNGSYWGWAFLNDVDFTADFGEANYGESKDPVKFELPNKLYAINTPEKKYYDGIDALGYLTDLTKLEPQLSPLLQEDYYNDIRTKAVFAKSDAEAKAVVENYREQLKKAGLEEFKAYLEKIYKENPSSITFRP